MCHQWLRWYRVSNPPISGLILARLTQSLSRSAGGHKMYHPTNYVLVTDLDDMEQLEYTELHKAQGGSESAVLASLSSPAAIAATSAQTTTTTPRPTPTPTPASAAAKETSTQRGKAAAATQAVSALERLTFQPYYDQRPTSGFTFNTNNTHIPATAAIEMPERAWQDCIMNTLHVDAAAAAASAAAAATATTETSAKSTAQQQQDEELQDSKQDSKQLVQQQIQQQQQLQQRQKLWNFVDPMQKAPCICTK